MSITHDCIIGYEIKKSNPNVDATLEYYVPILGTVVITPSAYEELQQNLRDSQRQPDLANVFPRHILAGLTRNAYELSVQPPVIDSAFLREGYKAQDLPWDFKQKASHLLKHLYEKDGGQHQAIELRAARDYPLTYSDSQTFEKVVEELELDGMITIRSSQVVGSNGKLYAGVELTDEGREAVEATHP